MDDINVFLFNAIAPGVGEDARLLAFAAQVSQLSGWVCLAVIGWATWRRPEALLQVVTALAVGAALSLAAPSIAGALEFPRPFMVGLSPPHLPHAAHPGLPSTHASAMFTVAFLLAVRPPLRSAGALLAGLAALTACSRIYLGLNFPQDIAAGILLALLVTAAVLLAPHAWRRLRRLRLGTGRAALRSLQTVLQSRRAACYLSLAFFALAVLIGLGMPALVPTAFVEEGGPVETGTILLYAVAALAVAFVRLPALSGIDKLCAIVVLVAFAAREADLHVALFGFSILKARFYSTVGSADQITVAVLVLALIALAALLLMKRHGRRWLTSPANWSAPDATVIVFMFVLLVAKSMDKLPGTLEYLGRASLLSSQVLLLMLSVEEILEFLLPGLVLLAIMQTGSASEHPIRCRCRAQAARRRGPAVQRPFPHDDPAAARCSCTARRLPERCRGTARGRPSSSADRADRAGGSGAPGRARR